MIFCNACNFRYCFVRKVSRKSKINDFSALGSFEMQFVKGFGFFNIFEIAVQVSTVIKYLYSLNIYPTTFCFIKFHCVLHANIQANPVNPSIKFCFPAKGRQGFPNIQSNFLKQIFLIFLIV